MNNVALILDICQETQVKNNFTMENKFSTVFTLANEVRFFLVSAKLKFSIAWFGVQFMRRKRSTKILTNTTACFFWPIDERVGNK